MDLVILDAAQKELRVLSDDLRARILDALLEASRHVGDPHAHHGIGMRKLAKEYWELRAGTGMRAVIRLAPGRLVVLRIGNHDEVQRFLKTL